MDALTASAVAVLAFAIPAAAFFIGAKRMPTVESTFAYIGFVLLAVGVLRLLFVAPYQLWREQLGEVGALKLELSEPERKEIAHMASIRAEKRLELAAELRQFHWLSFTVLEGGNRDRFNEAYGKLLALMGQAGIPESFDKIFGRFTAECTAMNRARIAGNDDEKDGGLSFACLEDMTDYLHGRVTAEQLALRFAEYPDEPELELDGVKLIPEPKS